eukprot:gene2993-17332_t
MPLLPRSQSAAVTSLRDADVRALCDAAAGHQRLRRIVVRDNQKRGCVTRRKAA